MANKIVQLSVSTTNAPAPSTLQRTGALISQGGSNYVTGTLNLLTQLSDLTAHLPAALTISAITWSASVVSVTLSTAHGWGLADVIPVTVSGCTPAGYNGTFSATVTGTTTFTYPLSVNPGVISVKGFAILADNAELLSMATTYFAQGAQNSVYVLELGEGTVSAGVTALTTFINANPGTVYSYLVPREWDVNASFLAFLGNYNNTTAQTYFFITTTTGTYSQYSSLDKCAFLMIQAPLAPATEFTCAAPFWVTLNYNPNFAGLVTPLSFSFLYGVTPYPTTGNGTLFTNLKTANVNYVGTGAEGGLPSNAVLYWGTMLDGNPFNYWYSIDWLCLTSDTFLSNAVINGSNNPQAPLLYNQSGINVLQDTETSVVSNGVSYGLAIGSVRQTALPTAQFAANFANGDYLDQLVVNADPFLSYTATHPTAYGTGTYGGLSVVWIPARGFTSILVSINATNFV